MDGAEIGRRLPLASQRIDVENAKRIGPFGDAFIGIHEQQQPALARPEPAPELGGQIGAGNLRDEVQRPLAFLRMLRGNRPRPFDVIGQHRQAAEP